MPRATEAPLIAPARCPSRLPATRGSYTTGSFAVFGRAGLSRATRPLASAVPDRGGIIQVSQMHGGVVIVVPLHRCSAAGKRGRGYRMGGARMAPDEAGRGDQERLAARISGLRALGVGDPWHRQRSVLRRLTPAPATPRSKAPPDPQGPARRSPVAAPYRQVPHRDLPAPLAPLPPPSRPVPGNSHDPSCWTTRSRPACPGKPAAQGRWPSDRSTCSVLPRRRCTPSDVPRISTASAASAPAARARAIRSARRSSGSGHFAGSCFVRSLYMALTSGE